MKTPTILLIFTLFVLSVFCEESSENVHISGSFRIAGEGEEIPKSAGIEQEHPFFQLEGMKIARAYLDRQYAKERAQREQQFGV
ncbi:hypothetical protein CRE_12559 [Caenorhabditis remanei]|uniref:Uncharacterized protein n=1 Tax=Caenorhabditis remanei TaxID=31234 RepID=E3M7M8_CAERE|nr:hypothetical protein CRE_12559 [Caenorhabditis remanei]